MATWHADYCAYPDCECAEIYEPVPDEDGQRKVSVMAARKTWRAKATVTVSIDVEEWAQEYGLDPLDVPKDATETIQRWADEYLRDQLQRIGFERTRILD